MMTLQIRQLQSWFVFCNKKKTDINGLHNLVKKKLITWNYEVYLP